MQAAGRVMSRPMFVGTCPSCLRHTPSHVLKTCLPRAWSAYSPNPLNPKYSPSSPLLEVLQLCVSFTPDRQMAYCSCDASNWLVMPVDKVDVAVL